MDNLMATIHTNLVHDAKTPTQPAPRKAQHDPPQHQSIELKLN